MNNLEILSSREKKLNSIQGVRVGDYLKMPYGMYTRFTYKLGEYIQVGGDAGTYFLNDLGFLSYSGGIDSGVYITDLEVTNEVKPGAIWFFNNNEAKAYNGFDTIINFRVFKLKDKASEDGLRQIRKYEIEMLKK